MDWFQAAAARAGAAAVAPLAVPAVPFGVVFGLLVAETPQVDNLAGWSSSFIIVAGASQLAAITLLGTGASVVAVVTTVAVINARHLMYSAALSSRWRTVPRWFRITAPYLLIDQVFAVNDQLGPEVEDDYRMSYYAGTVALLFPVWMIASTVGLLVGDAIPESWSLDYTVPLMFGALMILGVSNRPGVAAALTGAAVAVAGRDLPNGLGLLLGVMAGVLVGAVAEEVLLGRRDPDAEAEA